MATYDEVTSLKIAITPVIATRREITRAIGRHYPAAQHQEERRKSLLVVDDDSTILAMLTHLFSGEYEVMTANNGLEAYHLAIDNSPNVILTDMQMPEMNGYALLAAIRQNEATKTIPVILMSAVNEAGFEENALTRGFFDFIPKPFKVTSFKERVRRAADFAENG